MANVKVQNDEFKSDPTLQTDEVRKAIKTGELLCHECGNSLEEDAVGYICQETGNVWHQDCFAPHYLGNGHRDIRFIVDQVMA